MTHTNHTEPCYYCKEGRNVTAMKEAGQHSCINCKQELPADTNHTDSVEAKNIAIHLTAILDKEVFKGQYSSSRLEAIEAIINRELTTLQATQSQQVEEAVEAEKKRILDELWRLVEWHSQEKNQMFGLVSANTTINALHQARGIVRGDNHASTSNTPNHQD